MNKFYLCLKKAEHDICNWWVVFTVFLFFFLRLPSLVEPDWYGDEGIYQVVGQAVRGGRLLYKGIFDNKPPFLYLIYAFFAGDLFFVRLASLLLGILAVIFIFLLARKLFKKNLSIFMATSIFALLLGLPLLEGNIANAENFMLAPVILAGLFIINTQEAQKKSLFLYFLSGILIALAFLTKIVAIFDLAAFLTILLVMKFYHEISLKSLKNYLLSLDSIKKIINEFDREIILIVSFILPIAITVLYFLFNGTFFYFLQAVLSQNLGYVSWGNYFLFPMGFLLFKLLLLAGALFLIIKYRYNLKFSGTAILIWLSFSIFNLFFSERPYTHYILVLLPAFSLFAGFLAEAPKKMFNIFLLIFLCLFILVSKTFWFGKNPVSYYKNYFEFVSGQRTAISYQKFFDKNTPRDYEVARFINSQTTATDKVFIWGNSAQIYYLAGKIPPGRFTVAYHVTYSKNAISETIKNLILTRPKFIVVLDDNLIGELKDFLSAYILKFNLINGVKIYER